MSQLAPPTVQQIASLDESIVDLWCYLMPISRSSSSESISSSEEYCSDSDINMDFGDSPVCVSSHPYIHAATQYECYGPDNSIAENTTHLSSEAYYFDGENYIPVTDPVSELNHTADSNTVACSSVYREKHLPSLDELNMPIYSPCNPETERDEDFDDYFSYMHKEDDLFKSDTPIEEIESDSEDLTPAEQSTLDRWIHRLTNGLRMQENKQMSNTNQ